MCASEVVGPTICSRGVGPAADSKIYIILDEYFY